MLPWMGQRCKWGIIPHSLEVANAIPAGATSVSKLGNPLKNLALNFELERGLTLVLLEDSVSSVGGITQPFPFPQPSMQASSIDRLAFQPPATTDSKRWKKCYK